MGEVAAEQEGELAELGQWFGSLQPAEKRAALASVAKALSFQDAAAPTAAPPPRHLPIPLPALPVFCDTALCSPAAEPAAAVAPAPARPLPLGDRTNTNLKQLSSKLHVAASKKQAPQVGAGRLVLVGGCGLKRANRSCALPCPANSTTSPPVPLSPHTPAAARGGCQGAAGLPAVGCGALQGGHAGALVPRPSRRHQAGGAGEWGWAG